MIFDLLVGCTPRRSLNVIDGESSRQRSFSKVASLSYSRVGD